MSRISELATSLLSENTVTWSKATGRQRVEILKAAGVALPEVVTETHSTLCRALTLKQTAALLDEVVMNPESDKAKAYRAFRQGDNDAKIMDRETLPFREACQKWGETRAVACVWETIHPDKRAEISGKKWTLRPELDRSEIDALCAALQALKA